MTEHLDTAALAAAVGRRWGRPVEIAGLRRLSGGASQELWSFEVGADDGTTPLVLRRDPRGAPASGVDEHLLLQLAAAAGVPVPPLRFALAPDDQLGHGFVMDHVDGETLGRRIVSGEAFAAARAVLPAQCGQALAAIHSIPVEASRLRVPTGAEHPVLRQVDDLTALLDGFGEVRPVFELAMRWLRLNVPSSARTAVVHGDFRVGNLIVGPEGLRAVLDWELAHVGDPAEDIGWLCVRSWRFGGAGRVGGIGDLDDLIEAYRRSGGEVEADDIRYWEVFGNLRWGIICLVQTFTHLNGVRRSVELAAIGRRVCEVEHDLMELLG